MIGFADSPSLFNSAGHSPRIMADLSLSTAEERDVRTYELAVLYPFPFPQKEEQTFFNSLNELFSETGAKVLEKDLWGRRGLAYSIGGSREGQFAVFLLALDPLQLRELDRGLKILKNVLRHLLTKPPKHYVWRKYSELFLEWQERGKIEQEQRAQDAEERLKQQVLEKAKRETKKAQVRQDAAAPVASKSLSKEAIAQELEKLISDKDIAL